jgi:peptidoglycan hydrolase-like protein with peptidoglycan-binding domain
VALSAWKRVAVLGAAAAALITAIGACEANDDPGSASPTAAVVGESTAPSDDPGTTATGQAAVEDPNSDLPDGWDGSSTTVAPATTAAKVEKVPLGRTLSQGMSGQDVLRMQERLVELKFDPGKPDGQFGPATAQAVWAFERLVLGQKANGSITPEDWDKLFGDVVIAPRRTQTTAVHMEVYLPQQVGVLFKDGAPELVTTVSTGDGKEWCSEEAARCGLSLTPGGIYKFYRRQSDWWEGSLGRMYNPVYFNYGIAVHGMTYVPNYPASHGCVRIPMHIAKYFPDLVNKGDQVFVWDGKKEPEKYGAQPPPFDRPDPNATTTTVAPPTTAAKPTTTTKVPATSAATTTTHAPSTTHAPATTAPATTAPPKTAPPKTAPPKTAPATTAPPATTAAAAAASSAVPVTAAAASTSST